MKISSLLLRALPVGLVVAAVFVFPARQRVSVKTKHAPTFTHAASRMLAARADATGMIVHLKLRELLAAKTGDEETPARVVDELLALLTKENVAGIVCSLSTNEFASAFGTAALERWLDFDSTEAARWIAARQDATEEHAWLVARHLLKNPEELRVFCEEVPDSEWKQHVLNGAGLTVLSENPAEAIAFARQMEAGPAQTNLLETVAVDWTHRDPRAALAWIVSVDDPAQRERLFAVGAKAIASSDPDLAVGWLDAAVKSEGVLNDTTVCIAETWVAQNPAAAAQWVARMPARGPRDAAVEAVARNWSQADPAAALAWIQTLPEREAIMARLTAKPADAELEDF